MRPRLLGGTVLALVVLLLAVVPAPAAQAVEDDFGHAPLPSIDEVGTGSEVAEQFEPILPSPPPFTGALLWPLIGAAILLAFIVLVLYLRWMPRFSSERDSSRRR